MQKYFYTFIVLATISTSYSSDHEDNRVEQLIEKSQKTRETVSNKVKTNPRDPASHEVTLKEFDQLMNEGNDQDWLEEVENLSE